MGMSAHSGRRMSNRGGTRGGYQPMSEINVTPFVDVMLVLLIVFMVTAPLLTVGVPIDLPKTEANPITETVEPIVVSVDATGQVFIGKVPVTSPDLVAKLRAVTNENMEARVFVRGDRSLQYGTMMEIMGRLTRAGFRRLALIGAPPETP